MVQILAVTKYLFSFPSPDVIFFFKKKRRRGNYGYDGKGKGRKYSKKAKIAFKLSNRLGKFIMLSVVMETCNLHTHNFNINYSIVHNYTSITSLSIIRSLNNLPCCLHN